MATMKDVAELAGVSTATVSHVVNGTKRLSPETTERVLLAIEQVKYNPNTAAKSLRSGQSNTVGVLVEDIRGLPVPQIVSGIEEILTRSGYRMLLYDLHLLEKVFNQYDQINTYHARVNNAIALLLASNADGIIFVGIHDRRIKSLFDPIDKPLVIAYSLGTAQDTYISYSNFDSAAQLTRLLIDKGHKRIALIAGHPDSYPTARRMDGFMHAMQEAGLDVPPSYIVQGDWEYESGFEQTKKLLALPQQPTAIFAMNDLMAAGCFHALNEAGLRVPEDISVIGFDNREISRFLQPPLTTIALPTREMGVQSAVQLIDMIRNPSMPPRPCIIPCSIVERDSVSAPSRECCPHQNT